MYIKKDFYKKKRSVVTTDHAHQAVGHTMGGRGFCMSDI